MVPYLSVVIPAFNEADGLSDCLKSLQRQKTTLPYEIIVVDNNSTDQTAAIAQRCGVRVVHENQPGVCAARNAGLQVARGEIVVSTDADCAYPDDWLAQIGQAFSNQPDLVLLISNYRFSQAPRWANVALVAYEWLCLQLNYAFGVHGYVSAANLAFRRSAFPQYDTRLTQGGDELYVLSRLKPEGRVLYRFTNTISTSSRRLKQGFTKTFFKDFLAAYLINYFRTRQTGINKSGTYTAHRQSAGGAPNNRIHVGAYVVFLFILMGGLGFIYSSIAILLGMVHNLPLLIGSAVALTSGLVAYAVFNPHTQLAGPQPYNITTSRKVVALTFDDGPNGEFTLAIADEIEKYGGRATFFQVGQNVVRQPEITKQLHTRGHLIGNHSFNHAYVDYFRRGWHDSVVQTNEVLRSVTGVTPRYVRLPWLFRTPWLLQPLYNMGLQPVSGTFVSVPEFRQRDGVTMARRFISKVNPGDIVIMHDGYNATGADRTETVRAVRELCQRLHAAGYQFVRIDEML